MKGGLSGRLILKKETGHEVTRGKEAGGTYDIFG